MPTSNPTDKKLTTHIVTYLDILGLQEKIRSVLDNQEDSEELLNNYYISLKNALNRLKPPISFIDKKTPLWRYKIFTDNIVLAIPINSHDGEDEFGITSYTISAFQLELALGGWFVRGGVSIGPLYIDDNIVFGPALVEAYNLEDQIARDPRIVLSENTKKLVTSHLKYYGDPYSSPQNGYVLIDVDSQAYLNYLFDPIGWGHDEKSVTKIIREHKKKIEYNLNAHKDNPTIWAKYRWVSAYHNFFCRTWLPNAKRISISSRALANNPKLLVSSRTKNKKT